MEKKSTIHVIKYVSWDLGEKTILFLLLFSVNIETLWVIEVFISNAFFSCNNVSFSLLFVDTIVLHIIALGHHYLYTYNKCYQLWMFHGHTNFWYSQIKLWVLSFGIGTIQFDHPKSSNFGTNLFAWKMGIQIALIVGNPAHNR